MEFQLIFYAYLVLCLIVFFEVLITIKKNSLLKICFLLILVSLFVMNYFSCISVTNRVQFIVVKCMRLIYVCSTMIAVIHLATPKIPRWIIGATIIFSFFLIGLRIFNFNNITIETTETYSSHIFSVGPEFNTPYPFARYLVYLLATLVTALTFYYYRKFLLKMNKEETYYKQFYRWIISMVMPFFLLIIFGVFGTLQIVDESLSPYLFSLFSGITIFSILFRPKLLNTTSYSL